MTNHTTALALTTAKGNLVEVQVDDAGSTRIVCNGKASGWSQTRPESAAALAKRQPKAAAAAGSDHVMLALGVTLPITSDQALTINAAIDAARQARSATPASRIAQRQNLLSNIKIAGDCEAKRAISAHTRGDDKASIAQYDAAQAPALAELAAFDAAHPEVAAQQARDKDQAANAAAARNAWN